jgi:hypothetical protein
MKTSQNLRYLRYRERVVNLFEDTGKVRELNRARTKHVTGNEEIVGAVIQAYEKHPQCAKYYRASIHRILKAKKY